MLRLFVLSCVTIFGFGSALFAAPAQGEIGGPCFNDAPACSAGICDRALGLCVACGMPGQPACEAADGGPECRLPQWDNQPVQLMDGRVFCAQETDDIPRDCGHVGYPACNFEDGPACFYGIYAPQRRPAGPGICLECGDFGEPCCENTDLVCDYGTCQGGICLPDGAQTSGGGASGAMPPRYTPAPPAPAPQPTAPAPAARAAHPCLDPDQPRDAYVLSYQVGMGGGGVSYPVKDNYICDFEGDFTVLKGSDLVGYRCDREGNAYVNCVERWRQTVSSQEKVHDGYVYRWRDDKFFLVVHPIE